MNSTSQLENAKYTPMRPPNSFFGSPVLPKTPAPTPYRSTSRTQFQSTELTVKQSIPVQSSYDSTPIRARYADPMSSPNMPQQYMPQTYMPQQYTYSRTPPSSSFATIFFWVFVLVFVSTKILVEIANFMDMMQESQDFDELIVIACFSLLISIIIALGITSRSSNQRYYGSQYTPVTTSHVIKQDYHTDPRSIPNAKVYYGQPVDGDIHHDNSRVDSTRVTVSNIPPDAYYYDKNKKSAQAVSQVSYGSYPADSTSKSYRGPPYTTKYFQQKSTPITVSKKDNSLVTIIKANVPTLGKYQSSIPEETNDHTRPTNKADTKYASQSATMSVQENLDRVMGQLKSLDSLSKFQFQRLFLHDQTVEALRRWVSTQILIPFSQRDFKNTSDLCSILGLRLDTNESLSQIAAMLPPQYAAIASERISLDRYCEVPGYPRALDYCRERLRNLAQDTYLVGYAWDSGEFFKGRSFSMYGLEHPTDAELLVNALGAYFDEKMSPGVSLSNRMAINPQTGRLEPLLSAMRFSSRYICFNETSLEKWKKKAGVIINKMTSRPPHFVVIGPGGNYLDISHGRNNVFHCIILLVWLLQREYDGYAGQLYLGDRSVDILSILEV